MSNVEKSEIKEYRGYRYITVRMPLPLNHVCGYVEIPAGHYLFGKSYSEPIPELAPYNKDVLNGEVGKRGAIQLFTYAMAPVGEKVMGADIFFNVHGSLTFGDKLLFRGDPTPIFDWAMGFDTRHFDDNETTQTHEFCERECRLFIDQLVKMDKELKNGK